MMEVLVTTGAISRARLPDQPWFRDYGKWPLTQQTELYLHLSHWWHQEGHSTNIAAMLLKYRTLYVSAC